MNVCVCGGVYSFFNGISPVRKMMVADGECGILSLTHFSLSSRRFFRLLLLLVNVFLMLILFTIYTPFPSSLLANSFISCGCFTLSLLATVHSLARSLSSPFLFQMYIPLFYFIISYFCTI